MARTRISSEQTSFEDGEAEEAQPTKPEAPAPSLSSLKRGSARALPRELTEEPPEPDDAPVPEDPEVDGGEPEDAVPEPAVEQSTSKPPKAAFKPGKLIITQPPHQQPAEPTTPPVVSEGDDLDLIELVEHVLDILNGQVEPAIKELTDAMDVLASVAKSNAARDGAKLARLEAFYKATMAAVNAVETSKQ